MQEIRKSGRNEMTIGKFWTMDIFYLIFMQSNRIEEKRKEFYTQRGGIKRIRESHLLE